MDIKKYKEAIKKITCWDSSGEVFGFIDIGDFKTNYIYEFYCSMFILNDLFNRHELEVIPNSKEEIKFPKSPAKKEGYSYFKVIISRYPLHFVEVWLGTKIRHSIYKKYSHAPDISFQIMNSPAIPTENDALMIIDAKFYLKGLDINTIDSFSSKVKRFGFPKSKNSFEELKFSVFKFLSNPTLITNSDVHKKSEELCKSENIIQIGHFDLDKTFIKIGAINNE
ncbi:hypothetical protein MM239_17015 [Belliella sp. DSM 111904]|uniref:Uncharacterized protein n=1 Tax=Belliella filtrata TaxID=2923435 RepID=A0ABS9V3X0_9BACT|nr:hypothetical protein [Belliella filtrata]MCH7411108.1 hypothetical protein [Belliella filtrata]